VRTNKRTHRCTQTDADERFTPATVVGVSDENVLKRGSQQKSVGFSFVASQLPENVYNLGVKGEIGGQFCAIILTD